MSLCYIWVHLGGVHVKRKKEDGKELYSPNNFPLISAEIGLTKEKKH